MKRFFSFNTIIAGRVLNETIINKNKQVFINKPGGGVLYAAAGFSLWKKGAGLIAKISENNSIEWTREFENYHFDTSGIKKISRDFEQRRFYSITNSNTVFIDNPQKHFFEIKHPLPKSLLGYEPPQTVIDKRNTPAPYSIQPDDIPKGYLQTNNLLLCPIDYYSHSLIPPFYRSQTNGNVILCASNGYMHPSFWFDIPSLIRGSSVFLTTENQIRNLFKGKSEDVWEMVEYIAQSDVEIVIIANATGTQYLYDAVTSKKYKISSYPSKVVDTVGAFAAFCGGFGAGFTTHFDPLRAGLMGSVSVSFNVEGSTPLHTLQSLPDLVNARLESLMDSVIVV
jgi:sugar/nucleoside kinase (ribokinase family)